MDPGQPMTLQELKDWHKPMINQLRDQKVTNGYTTPAGIRWGTSPVDIQNLSGVCLLVICGAVTTNVTWRDANNTNHSLSPADLVSLAAQLGVFVQTMYGVSWYHKANVDGATDINALLAYDINAGW